MTAHPFPLFHTLWMVLYASVATVVIGDDELTGEYEDFLSVLYPVSYQNVFFSKYYESPGKLKKVTLKNSKEIGHYFTLGFHPNEAIGEVPYSLELLDEKYGRDGVYSSESAVSYLVMREPDRMNDVYAAIDRFAETVSNARKTDSGRRVLYMRKDLWLVVATILDMINASPYLAGCDVHKKPEHRRILLNAIDACAVTPEESEIWSKITLSDRLAKTAAAEGSGAAIRHVAENFEKGFVVPFEYSSQFEHNVHFAGASICYVSVWSPNESAEWFRKLYTGMRGKDAIRYQEMQFPKDTWTCLVRVAALPIKRSGSGTEIEVIETPLVDEVLVRHYYTSQFVSEVNKDASDLRDIKYYQWKIAREDYLEGNKEHHDLIPEDAPVFYGFYADAPDLAAGGKFIVPMRFACTDCHMTQSFGKNVTRSFKINYGRRSQKLDSDPSGMLEMNAFEGNRWTLKYHRNATKGKGSQ